jgi:hypothetical protein
MTSNGLTCAGCRGSCSIKHSSKCHVKPVRYLRVISSYIELSNTLQSCYSHPKTCSQSYTPTAFLAMVLLIRGCLKSAQSESDPHLPLPEGARLPLPVLARHERLNTPGGYPITPRRRVSHVPLVRQSCPCPERPCQQPGQPESYTFNNENSSSMSKFFFSFTEDVIRMPVHAVPHKLRSECPTW